MIDEGSAAPGFALPAVVDGEFDRVALSDALGSEVVILAFYPGDFNPACEGNETDLDELDLFTMQKDVSILGISSDSVYSHRAFAEEFDLHIPLLSDPRGEVAEEYGVTVEDAEDGHLTKRAVIVLDLDGDVEYAWATDSLTELPSVERVRTAVDSIGGTDMAGARYRVGHAHYVEGRRAFTSAMHAFEDMEWMMAQPDFTQAEAEFDEAADHFNSAARFTEDPAHETYYERAEQKATALWQASEWLAEAANAFASGEGAKADSLREDAEGPLESARDIHDPVEPDDFPPSENPSEFADNEDDGIDDTELEEITAEHGEETEITRAEADDDGETDLSDDTVVGAFDLAEPHDDGGKTAEEDAPEGAGGDIETSDPGDGSDAPGSEHGGPREADASLVSEDVDAAAEGSSTAEATGDDDGRAIGQSGSDALAESELEAREEGEQSEAVTGEPDAEEVEGELDADEIELDLADPTAGQPVEPDDAGEVKEDEGDEDDAGEVKEDEGDEDDAGEVKEDEGDEDDDENVDRTNVSSDPGSGDHGVTDSL